MTRTWSPEGWIAKIDHVMLILVYTCDLGFSNPGLFQVVDMLACVQYIYIPLIYIYIYVFIVHNDTIYGVLYTIFMFCMRVYLFRSTLLMKGMSTTAIFMGKMMMTHSNFWGALASRERHIYI
jgi:hypothetical protein